MSELLPEGKRSLDWRVRKADLAFAQGCYGHDDGILQNQHSCSTARYDLSRDFASVFYFRNGSVNVEKNGIKFGRGEA